MSVTDIAGVDTILIFSATNIGLFLLFYRKISLISVAISIIAAYVIEATDIIYQLMSAFFPESNPQLFTVLYLSFIGILLAIISSVRKLRSIDRVIMTACLGAFLVTGALFHQVMIWQTLKAWEMDSGSSLLSLTSLEKNEFILACNTRGLRCHEVEKVKEADISGRIGDSLLQIESDTLSIAKSRGIAHHYAIFNDLDDEKIAFIAFFANPEGIRIVIDENGAKKAHSTIRISFYLLDIFSHSFWLAGALAIIAFHRKRFASFN